MNEQVFDKKQVQEAIGRIDNALAQLNVNRQVHIALTNDVQLIQKCCAGYFEDEMVIKDLENERANIIPINPEPGDENIEGGGDSV